MVLTDASLQVIWHDLECGSYSADLQLWLELADEHHATAILDVGAGSGRVTLTLARAGHKLIALDNDQLLLEALEEHSAGLGVRVVCADAAGFMLEPSVTVGLCVVPMQTIQLLGGSRRRIEFMRAARSHMSLGAILSIAIVTEFESFDCTEGGPGPSAESICVDQTVYFSRAIKVEVKEEVIYIERERCVFTPAGASEPSSSERDVVRLDRVSVSELHAEAAGAGFQALASRQIAATSEHVASTVVMLRAS